MLVTIYVVNHNYRRFLKRCLDSINAQTYSNVEVLIYDNGSIDDSRTLIENFDYKYPTSFFFQKNIGLTKTANAALKEASGELLIRLDADDELLPDALLSMVEMFEQDKDLTLVYPNYVVIDSFDNEIVSVQRMDPEMTKVKNNPCHGACTMISREAMIRMGGYFEEFDRQDGYDLWLKMLAFGKVKNNKRILFRYRRHEYNLTSSRDAILLTRRLIKKRFVESVLKGGMGKVLVVTPIRSTLLKRSNRPDIYDKIHRWSLQFTGIYDFHVLTSDEELQKFCKSISIGFKKRTTQEEEFGVDFKKSEIEENKEKYDHLVFLSVDYTSLDIADVEEAIHTNMIFSTGLALSINEIQNKIWSNNYDFGLESFHKSNNMINEKDYLFLEDGRIRCFSFQNSEERISRIELTSRDGLRAY